MASILSKRIFTTNILLHPFVGWRSHISFLLYDQSCCRSFSAIPKVHFAMKMDGKHIAKEIYDEIHKETLSLQNEFNEVPGLSVIQIGNRLDSSKYVQMKRRLSSKLGFADFGYNLPEDVTQEVVLNLIKNLNNNPKVHAILIQLPLPNHIDENIVTRNILQRKDVDGFHPNNVGLLTLRQEEIISTQKCTHEKNANIPFGVVPCTPKGCIELLDRYDVDIDGANAVVLGRSKIVGHPLATMLLHRNATVTICHSRTKNIPAICRQADIIVAAIGVPRFVKGHWIKPGAVVIDVGFNFVFDPTRKNKQHICGDVDYEGVRKVASLITPVPGGAGPMTVAMLMKNTLENAKHYWKNNCSRKKISSYKSLTNSMFF